MTTAHRHELRSSSIWAFILIGIGAIWLLTEAHVFSRVNLAVLFRLWPLLLIAFGLELLIGRGSRAISMLIGLGTVLLLVILMLAGPALGLAPNVDVQTGHFSEPVGTAQSAQVNLDLSAGNATVQALTGSQSLIDADIAYVGEIDFHATGTTEKTVMLGNPTDSFRFGDLFNWSFIPDDSNNLHWNVGLTDAIPLALHISGGVGDNTVNLSGIQLTGLDYNSGVGTTTISLPGAGSFEVDINGGVGNTRVNFAEGAAVRATIDAGVGNIVLDVPDSAPIRVEASSGLGSVSVMPNLNTTSGGDNQSVWETPAYASADEDARITIRYNGGVGNLTIQ